MQRWRSLSVSRGRSLSSRCRCCGGNSLKRSSGRGRSPRLGPTPNLRLRCARPGMGQRPGGWWPGLAGCQSKRQHPRHCRSATCGQWVLLCCRSCSSCSGREPGDTSSSRSQWRCRQCEAATRCRATAESWRSDTRQHGRPWRRASRQRPGVFRRRATSSRRATWQCCMQPITQSAALRCSCVPQSTRGRW